MFSKRLTARVAVVALGLASAAILVDGGTASAATQIGEMTVTPSTSSTTDIYPEFDTNGACPGGSTNMIVRMFGTGLPSDGENLSGNTSLGIITGNAQGGKHPVAQTTFKAIFQGAGIVNPTGQYTVRAQCIDASESTQFGDFVGLVNFTSTGTAFEASYGSSVPAAVTSTSLAAVSSPVTFGASVTFNATVTPSAAGTVQFKDGATNLGTPQAVTGGASSYTTSALGAGSHSITAQFIPTDSNAYQGSTSSARALTVNKAATTVSLTTNGPTAQYQVATFTATTTAGVAGTVQFTVDGTNVGGPQAVSGGTATYSSSSLGQATYTVGATFTPTAIANYNPSTAATATHIVGPPSGATQQETITATVQAGGITITLPGTAAAGDGLVDLGNAVMNADGTLLVATGDLDEILVTDTRAGDPGWVATGVVSSFISGANSVNAYNLGWEPEVVSTSANQVGATLGGIVLPGAEAVAGTTPATAGVGLGAPRTLFTTLDNAGNGSARLGGHLTLQIPTDAPAGAYTATLTFTAI